MTDPASFYRERARQHLQKAKGFLGETDVDDALRHACLELRMCIEALTYGLLAAYLHEVSNEAMAVWQPRRVLQELAAADPTANLTRTIRVFREDELGRTTDKVILQGTDRRFDPKWADKAHNALGNFLHEPSLNAVRNGTEPKPEAIRNKCIEILSELEAVLSSTIYHVNFGQHFELKCECGFHIKRKTRALESAGEFICANCGAIYDTRAEADGSRTFVMRTATWTCDCETENVRPMHQLKEEGLERCSGCGKPGKMRRVWTVQFDDAT